MTATVAALAGVAGRESGLASGLSNTALQIGTALGVAIVSTVAVSRSADYLAAHKGANPLVVLTEGYQSAFVACAVLAGIGLALALLLPGRRGKQRTSCRNRSWRPAQGLRKGVLTPIDDLRRPRRRSWQHQPKGEPKWERS